MKALEKYNLVIPKGLVRRLTGVESNLTNEQPFGGPEKLNFDILPYSMMQFNGNVFRVLENAVLTWDKSDGGSRE